MAYYMDSVNVSAERYARAVVDSGQKPDPVPVSFFPPATQMKRVGDDSVVDSVPKPDAVTVSYYTTAASMKRVGDDDPEGVVVPDPTATELCAAPTANDGPMNVQAAAAAAVGAVGPVPVVPVGPVGPVGAVGPVGPPGTGVAPGVVPPQMQKPKLTVGATQLTVEQKITFARMAIAWKSQGRPMREFDSLMKAAGYQVSPSSLAQWMKQPDATCVLPPPRKRKERDASKRKFVRSWVPKM